MKKPKVMYIMYLNVGNLPHAKAAKFVKTVRKEVKQGKGERWIYLPIREGDGNTRVEVLYLP